MGRPVDYETARKLLAEEFKNAEKDFRNSTPVEVPAKVVEATKKLFASTTQAYREVLIGCSLARILDPKIDVRLPYVNQGENAFNGRTLDEKVVNPFLHERTVPCSKGPYLSAFRRNVSFKPETAKGLRDREGYAALLTFIEETESVERKKAKLLLRYLLCAFVRLRDAAQITLARIQRLSLEQYGSLTDSLLQTPSKGLLPVLLSVAMFETIKNHFNLDWEIQWQGINVADRATGVSGDITITKGGTVILTVEVTERPIDRSRVVSTFNTKIAPQGIDDYLFFFSNSAPEEGAKTAARQYFAQGHDISFLSVKDWLINSLGTIGTKGRVLFTKEFLKLLESSQVPAAIKVAWNDIVKGLLK